MELWTIIDKCGGVTFLKLFEERLLFPILRLKYV
jgi:hypothetical protein